MAAGGTLCRKCHLWYLFPKRLDWERNPCPRCGFENRDQGAGVPGREVKG